MFIKKALTLCVIVSASALGGCSFWDIYPEHLDSINDVYPQASMDGEFEAAPMTSKSSAVFGAPYVDVYAVVRRSAAQNQWNLQTEDEAAGSIRATRVTRDQARTGDSFTPVDRNFYYLINVDEISGTESRVRVIAKTQAQCFQVKRGQYAAISLGLSEAYTAREQKECRAVGSKTQWAQGDNSAKAELENLIVLIRNNLIALGLE